MKTILVPTDFSANSVNALKYALEMNREIKAKILLMHTFETNALYSGMGTFTAQMDYKNIHDAAARELKAFHKKYFPEGYHVDLVLQQGLASSRICEIAMEKKVDMIIMGTTGTGAAVRLVVGSNASRVAKNAHCKVMLIPVKAKFEGFQKMVYATDLSVDNLLQTKEIVAIAKKFNTELLFLHIDNSGTDMNTDLLKDLTKRIKNYVSYPKKSGFVCADTSTANGVDTFLKKQKANCLVMFHRHRNLFGAIYNPGLTQKISLHTTMPILVVHEGDFFES